MAHELIEVSILLAALNKETGEAKRLIRQMSHQERMRLSNAALDVNDWIEDIEQSEREIKLGMGVQHG